MFQKTVLPRIRWKSFLQPWIGMDWLLFLGAVGLMTLGCVMIRSITFAKTPTYWTQNAGTGLVGIIAILCLSRWRYDLLIRWRWLVYGITNFGLLCVMLFGKTELGATRWINILGFNVQPSEFAKLGIIITLAALLHERPANTIESMFRAMSVVALPWTFIFLEPNLGTSLVFGAITLGMLYWGNANPGWLLLLLSPIVSAIMLNSLPPALTALNPVFLPLGFGLWFVWVAVMGIVAFRTLPWPRWGSFGVVVVNLISGGLSGYLWMKVLQPYQKERVTMFLNPEQDPLNGGYHLIQSRIAIGAGQIFGQGLNKGTQTQLNFIPEQHTDFIFAAIGEELGFVGSIAVLLTFLLICYRLLAIAQNAKDDFGSLLAIGVFSMIVFQTFVNIGMTIGLSPVTGIPLPFLSHGRSALIMNFLAIGLVESVANHRQKMRY
jgi:rod shape determining protein RodA